MSTEEQDEFKKKLEALKPKKKKLEVAEGLLSDAKSYEGKLLAVQIIAERERDRVVLLFKKMLQPEPPKKHIEPTTTAIKPPTPPKKKSFLGRK
jgi:hypothetical protein